MPRNSAPAFPPDWMTARAEYVTAGAIPAIERAVPRYGRFAQSASAPFRRYQPRRSSRSNKRKGTTKLQQRILQCLSLVGNDPLKIICLPIFSSGDSVDSFQARGSKKSQWVIFLVNNREAAIVFQVNRYGLLCRLTISPVTSIVSRFTFPLTLDNLQSGNL